MTMVQDRSLFSTDAALGVAHDDTSCACPMHLLRSRRLFTGLLATAAVPAWAQGTAAAADEGVRRDVGKESKFTKFFSAEQVEGAAQQQYAQMLTKAQQQRELAPDSHPQVERLRYIAQRLIPSANGWNERARQWKWEVNLLGSRDLNAFCMPGGKIAFYYGILALLQLSDDEVATIMGHEMAHALREHARERMGKTAATRLGAGALSSLLGLGNLGDAALNMGAQLLTLRFSREDESEADIVGMDLAARGGFDPAAGVTLWQKMMAANKGAPPQFLSTHPAGATRIKDIEGKLGKVQPIYAKAAKPERKFGPPAKPEAAAAPKQ
jgi:predicted Zn-dependent protease